MEKIYLAKTQVFYCNKCNGKLLELKTSDKPFKPNTLGLDAKSYCTKCQDCVSVTVVNSNSNNTNYINCTINI